jgi:hypothetical protein
VRRLQCESCYDQHNATHCFLKFFGRNSDPIFLLPKGTKNEQRSSLVHDKVCDGPQCRSEGCIVGLRYSCADCLASFGVSFDLCEKCYKSQVAHDASHAFKRFDKPVTASTYTYVVCPPQQKSPIHSNIFCHGPNCKAVGFIAGTRYTCAYCPPSVDLCQDSYKSEAAHDASHVFKRFDKPVTGSAYAYVMCPPQQKGPIHSNTFCHGPNCKAVGFIVGTRYTCAYCPPSVDLCQDCYKSEPAHDSSHPFKQYDNPMTAAGYTYAMCPPQSHSQAQPPQQAHSRTMQSDLSSVSYMRPPPRQIAYQIRTRRPINQATNRIMFHD